MIKIIIKLLIIYYIKMKCVYMNHNQIKMSILCIMDPVQNKYNTN